MAKKKRRIRSVFLLVMLGVALVSYYHCLPSQLFQNVAHSSVLYAADGSLLSASVSEEEQWYFPQREQLPKKYITAVLAFEDKRFFNHIGVDFIAFARALKQNIQASKIVSGASTITMQTIRLHRKNPPRTVFEKLIEIILATRLEFRLSKDEILLNYANHAPFGGNVIGIETAAWRYFGKPIDRLSWSEASLLAVLPNSPGLINTSKNRDLLKLKRNKLLSKLKDTGEIDDQTYEAAILESVPPKPLALPQHAPHLLQYLQKTHGPSIFNSTINYQIQNQCNQIAQAYKEPLAQNNVHNLSILVIDIIENKAIAYVGNLPSTGSTNQEFVDIIQAPRSTGSLLKPFLYAAALDEGLILEKSYLPDYPIPMQGFLAQNFNKKYQGLVPANQALIQSLNIPFAYLLQQYGIEKFRLLCLELGLEDIRYNANYYGIPLILGGAESSLWDLTNAYAWMGKSMLTHTANDGFYDELDKIQCRLLSSTDDINNEKQKLKKDPLILKNAGIWNALNNMRNVSRPDEQGGWELYESSKPISWKTGTSNGFKDAWSIGVNGRYAIGVWVGNADGEGRPGLIGSKVAAPIFFRVLNSLPNNSWFTEPIDDFKELEVCSVSGQVASGVCPKETQLVSYSSQDLPVCTYHQRIYLDSSEQYEVAAQCYDMQLANEETRFVVPSRIRYYLQEDAVFMKRPPMHPFCRKLEQKQTIKIIYPEDGLEIYQPNIGDGQRNPFVVQAFHENEDEKVFWHLDGRFLGETMSIHERKISCSAGIHKLLIIDEEGNRDRIEFRIVE